MLAGTAGSLRGVQAVRLLITEQSLTTNAAEPRTPITDAIIIAVSGLVDDAGATKEPSHSDLDLLVGRAGLSGGDPKAQGRPVGKSKRVRAILSWAMENAPNRAEVFCSGSDCDAAG